MSQVANEPATPIEVVTSHNAAPLSRAERLRLRRAKRMRTIKYATATASIPVIGIAVVLRLRADQSRKTSVNAETGSTNEQQLRNSERRRIALDKAEMQAAYGTVPADALMADAQYLSGKVSADSSPEEVADLLQGTGNGAQQSEALALFALRAQDQFILMQTNKPIPEVNYPDDDLLFDGSFYTRDKSGAAIMNRDAFLAELAANQNALTRDPVALAMLPDGVEWLAPVDLAELVRRAHGIEYLLMVATNTSDSAQAFLRIYAAPNQTSQLFTTGVTQKLGAYIPAAIADLQTEASSMLNDRLNEYALKSTAAWGLQEPNVQIPAAPDALLGLTARRYIDARQNLLAKNLQPGLPFRSMDYGDSRISIYLQPDTPLG